MTNLTSTLTLRMLDGVSKPARSVAMALKDVENDIKAVAKGLANTGATDRFVASLGKLKLSKAEIQAVSTAWRDYSKSAALAADSSSWTKGQIADVKAWEKQTLSALRTVKSEQAAFYRSLSRPPPPGFMSRIGGAMGSLLPFAGPVILRTVYKGVEGAAAIQGEDIANKVAGIPQGERAAADRQAVALSAKYNNLNTAEVLHTYRELRSVLRDPSEVPAMMDIVTRTKAAMEAGGLDSSGLVYALKSAEMLGLGGSPAKMKDFLNAFVKAQQVEGKTITPEGLYDFAQQLKAAAPNLSPQFVNTLGPLLAQEMQGGRAGTSVQQFEKQIQGGFQGQLHAAAKEFVALGLAKTGDFETTKSGEIKGMKRGHSVVGAALANTDPDKWVYTVLVPALHKAGYKSDADMLKELPRLFPNSNAANIVAKLIQQREQWAAKAERVAAGEGVDAVDDQLKGVGVAFGALTKQLDDLMSALDSPAMQDIGAGLSWLASSVGWAKGQVDHFAQAFPNAARAVADLGVAVGVVSGGFLSLKLLTGLTGGFGLGSSALALKGAAAELSAAAGKLGVASGLPGGPGRPPNGPFGGLGWGRIIASVASAVGLALRVADAPKVGSKEWADDVNDRNKRWDDFMASILPPGWVTPAAPAVPFGPQPHDLFGPGGVPIFKTKPIDLNPLNLDRYDFDDMRSGDDREATRGRALSALKPAPDATVRPKADTSGLAEVKFAAEGGKAVLDSLNATVRPMVDTSDIARARSELQAFLADLARAGSLMSGLNAGGRASISPLGKTQRGNFSFGGVSGE
jgi:hypothetical protein